MRRAVVQVLASAVLFALCWHALAGARWPRAAFDGRWMVGAVACASAAFPLLAQRWCLLARALGLPLTRRDALREYYLSTLLNQIVPGGVAGDGLRVVRHARGTGLPNAAASVLLDRASGQLALWLVVGVTLVAWPLPIAVLHGRLAAAALALVTAALIVLALRARRSRFRALLAAGRRAFFEPRRLAHHMALSLALVAVHVATFFAAAHAAGLPLRAADALRIGPLVLVAASLPATFAGWGAREAAAAALFAVTGRSAAGGLTVSIVYGAAGLVASLPGVWAWWQSRRPFSGARGSARVARP